MIPNKIKYNPASVAFVKPLNKNENTTTTAATVKRINCPQNPHRPKVLHAEAVRETLRAIDSALSIDARAFNEAPLLNPAFLLLLLLSLLLLLAVVCIVVVCINEDEELESQRVEFSRRREEETTTLRAAFATTKTRRLCFCRCCSFLAAEEGAHGGGLASIIIIVACFISGFVVASAVTRERVHSCARVSFFKFLLVVARV